VLAIALLGRARVITSRKPQVIGSLLHPAAEKATFLLTGNTAGPPVLSRTGCEIAFAAKNADGKPGALIRSLNSAVAQPMSGTEGAT